MWGHGSDGSSDGPEGMPDVSAVSACPRKLKHANPPPQHSATPMPNGFDTTEVSLLKLICIDGCSIRQKVSIQRVWMPETPSRGAQE